MGGTGEIERIETAVRSLAAALRALRLYPSTSPIPGESAALAATNLQAVLAGASPVHLAVGRDGFTWESSQLSPGVPSVADLCDTLRSHGVASAEFRQGVDAEAILAFLSCLLLSPQEAKAEGGVSGLLAKRGVAHVQVTDLSLKTSVAPQADDQELDLFLQGLAGDPAHLATWLNAAGSADRSTLGEGLSELEAAMGAAGTPALLASLASAFGGLETATRDRLLELACETSAEASVARRMVQLLDPAATAAALCAGEFGGNLLSLSATFARLDLGESRPAVLDQIRELLQRDGRSEGEMDFFAHMVDLKTSPSKSRPDLSSEEDFRTRAAQADVADDELHTSQAEVHAVSERQPRRTLAALLMLLEQQTDFGLFCEGIDKLAGMVPGLIEHGDLELALHVLKELDGHCDSAAHPWPELTYRIRAAITSATSQRSMTALLAAAAQDPGAVERARAIANLGGESAQRELIECAIASSDDGALGVAGEVVGWRLGELVSAAAASAPASRIGPVVRCLLGTADQHSLEAIEEIVASRDAPSRREAAKALAGGGVLAVKYLEELLADPDDGVATEAARALSTCPNQRAVAALATELEHMATDGKRMALAPEVVSALSHMPDEGATEALLRFSKRRGLVRARHLSEIRALARQALESRFTGEVPR